MRMKKTTLMVILMFMLALNSSFIYAVLVAPCGPSTPPEVCQVEGSCGKYKCTTMYYAKDIPASGQCQADKTSCIAKKSTCGQAGTLFTCTSSIDSYSICDFDCTSICQTQVYAKYTASETASETAAIAWRTGIIDSGLFEQIVLCDEMTDCIKLVSISNFQSFNRLRDCDGSISDSMKKKILDNHDPSKWESFLENTKANNELIKPGKQLSPDGLAARVKVGGLKDELLLKTNVETLADKSVRTAMAGAQRKLTLWKQSQVWMEVIKSNKVFKYALLGKTVFGVASTGVGFLNGGGEDGGNLQAAQSLIDDSADTVVSNGFLSQTIVCDDGRIPSSGNADCFMDFVDGASIWGGGLPSDNKISFGSIHILSPSQNNMYTLTGFENKGIVYEDDGFVNIHKGGTTKISVAGDGAAISDMKGNKFLLKGGILTYNGVGTENVDTYTGNAVTAHLNSFTVFDATEDRGGDVFGTVSLAATTGAVTSTHNDGDLAISFNHYTTPDFKNAIDLGDTGSGFQIIARGFGDIILLGEEKLFPMLSRNVLKGDSAIIFNKDVKVINSYAARDHTYLYVIKSDGISTKVRARGKIIQDSAGLKREFTIRQRDLVYG